MTKHEFEAAVHELRKRIPGFAHMIAPIYRQLQWKWGSSVPYEDEIAASLHEKLDVVVVRGGGYCDSGGLRVSIEGDDMPALMFTVEDYAGSQWDEK